MPRRIVGAFPHTPSPRLAEKWNTFRMSPEHRCTAVVNGENTQGLTTASARRVSSAKGRFAGRLLTPISSTPPGRSVRASAATERSATSGSSRPQPITPERLTKSIEPASKCRPANSTESETWRYVAPWQRRREGSISIVETSSGASSFS